MAAELKITVDELNESLLQISHSSMVALDELWSTSNSSGDQVVADGARSRIRPRLTRAERSTWAT